MRQLICTIVFPILFGMGCLVQSVHAQTYVLIQDESFVVDAREAIDFLYNRNEEAARATLKPWIDEHPDHPLWPLWEAMELWWYVLSDLADHSYDDEFFNKMKKADYEAGRVLSRESDHPDALIVRAVANGYAARQNANRGNWITSINIGRRAYQAYMRLMEVVPDLPDNDFAMGMKRYYAAHVVENYPVVRAASWFLPDGDKETGIESLRRAFDFGVFARPEAGYFLGFILLNYENQHAEASVIFKSMKERYPKNSYYRRLYVRSLTQMRQHDLAVSEIESAFMLWEAEEPEEYSILHEELYYWLGRIQFQQGEYERAVDSFTLAHEIGLTLPNTKERDFHTVSAYYSGRAFEMLNQSEEAKKYYRFALNQNVGDEIKKNARTRLNRL